MCGIVGLVSRSADSADESRLVDEAITCLAHRGPDGSGNKSYKLENSTSVYFGHTRLAIIDLSDEGLQPFESRDSRYSLTYNGEIYNYLEIRQELENLGVRFRSSSDTEVLLEALIRWRESALDRLEGMFAFAFLDKQRNELLLARDPFGIKPLHYASSEGKMAFASEIRALRAVMPGLNRVNSQIASNYLLFGHVQKTSETFVEGISALLPGHYMVVDLRGVLAKPIPIKYWDPDFSSARAIDFDSAKESFRDLLFESVSLHMRSDVPVGSALSGGLDSSSIVSIMRHLNPSAEIHTFSFIASDPRVNEEAWVDKVVASAGVVSHKVKPKSEDLFENDLDSLISCQGEPFPDLSIYAQYKVFELAKKVGIRVSLDGQGADEMLAGYNGYAESRILSLIENGKFREAITLVKSWSRWPGRSLRSLLSTGVAELLPGAVGSKAFIAAAQSFGLMKDSSRLYFSDRVFEARARSLKPGTRGPGYRGRRLSKSLLLALGPKGLSSLLRFADRNSMNFSVESRVPFLNRKLVEFTLSLPEQYLLSPEGETKHILRHSLRGIVPDEILSRRDKIGFEASTSGWGLGSSVLKEVSENLDGLGLLVPEPAKRSIREVINGTRDLDSSLWRVINYARWVQLEGVRGLN